MSAVVKPLAWVGSSYDDLQRFPPAARRAAGYQLRRVQSGVLPDDWKAMSTVGAGVYEIRVRTGAEHRVFYVAKYQDAIYVLHAFEKRTQKTRDLDIQLAQKRLADVERLHARR